jgi:hypothetical protein
MNSLWYRELRRASTDTAEAEFVSKVLGVVGADAPRRRCS